MRLQCPPSISPSSLRPTTAALVLPKLLRSALRDGLCASGATDDTNLINIIRSISDAASSSSWATATPPDLHALAHSLPAPVTLGAACRGRQATIRQTDASNGFSGTCFTCDPLALRAYVLEVALSFAMCSCVVFAHIYRSGKSDCMLPPYTSVRAIRPSPAAVQ